MSALEHDLKVPLFHRHARGLVLTEQGELLLRTAREVMAKLDAAEMALDESREKPNEELRITTSFGIGMGWLTPRLGPFLDLYPGIKLEVILADEELDLGLREADVALRMREPSRPDLIRRHLFAVLPRRNIYAGTAIRTRSTNLSITGFSPIPPCPQVF